MPFAYSCFISYRHGQRELLRRILEDLYEALSGELEFWLDEEVYLDRNRLKGGDFYNEALARALCQSVCMIMFFTPRYFDRQNTYCAREYKAMEKLEETRLKAADSPLAKHHGLIIPIIIRGSHCLPEEIKKRRQCYNFDDFVLSDKTMSEHPKYAEKIRWQATR